MVDADRQEILRRLRAGSDALRDALNGMDESLAGLRPTPESWSVLECVEHMIASETLLLSRLREATPRDESHEDRAREAKLEGLATNRLRRIEAPEAVMPKGEFEGLEKAMEGFERARRETVRYVEEFSGDLRSRLVIHPLITRPLNCYEMLLLMALHPARHAMQIAEIRNGLVRCIDERVTAP
ncbi:MAG: DinB family protein [Terracidiphilus sp.]|jgi:hypothetical protein